ncbi:MAG: hypothetical protein JO150_05695 [Acidobacteriaceae bacterium]|nr:hypothetical protein [Acidobacteriaceae bacterium]
MATITRKCLPWMLTLTYPAEWSPDSRRWKADLAAWLKRLRRIYPGVGIIWKLEFQKRGAPHFHCFLWNLPTSGKVDKLLSAGHITREMVEAEPAFHGEFKAWLSRSWFEVVGSGDPKHAKAGTRFEKIRHPQGIMRYVAGYMSKEDQTAPGHKVGRYWGAANREAIPVGQEQEQELSARGYRAVLRTARRWQMAQRRESFLRARAAGRKPQRPRLRNNQSMALICDAEQWLSRIPDIVKNAEDNPSKNRARQDRDTNPRMNCANCGEPLNPDRAAEDFDAGVRTWNLCDPCVCLFHMEHGQE